MNKTEISAKILKREKIIVFNIRITPKTNHHMCKCLSLQPNMKQIHKAVQVLESYIGFWRPSWILLKKLENAEKNLQGEFPRANMHTANI